MTHGYLTDGNAAFGRRHGERNRRIVWAVVVCALVLAFVAAFSIGLPCTVDGQTVLITPGLRVSQATAAHKMTPPAGRVLSAANGSVLATAVGGPGRVVFRGAPLSPDARLFPFRAYGLARGADTVERTKTVTETVAFEVVYKGEGAEEKVVMMGRNGSRVATVGVVSGDVVESRWLIEPRSEVVQRSASGAYAKASGKVRGSKKLVALTFDDGPDPKYTAKILEMLKSQKVKATFFVLSPKAKNHPDLIKRMIADGHLVANHSRTHRDLTKLNAQELEGEFRRSQEAIESVTGTLPGYFRAPYGIVNSKVIAEAKRKKVRLVGWEVDSTDWSKPGTATVVKRATPKRDGGVTVLMHDSGGDRKQTVAALPAIIKEYKKRGYEFITVDGFY